MDPLVVDFVLAREGYACIVCGSDYLVQLAHIRSRGSRPDLYNEPSNLCVLCFNCHQIRQHTRGELDARKLEEVMMRVHGYDYGAG